MAFKSGTVPLGKPPYPTFSPYKAPIPTGKGPRAPVPPKRPPARPGPRPRPRPFPLDATATAEIAAARRQYQTTGAGLAYSRRRTMQEFGFEDLSDPYNRASMLERSYHQAQAGQTNQGAASGQLYSGGLQAGLNEGRFQYERNRSDLRRSYEDTLHGYTQQGQQASDAYQSALQSAQADALQRALQNRPEDPGAPRSGGGGADHSRGYARLDAIRAFLHKHPGLRHKDRRRYARLIAEANHLKSTLPSRK